MPDEKTEKKTEVAKEEKPAIPQRDSLELLRALRDFAREQAIQPGAYTAKRLADEADKLLPPEVAPEDAQAEIDRLRAQLAAATAKGAKPA